MTARTGSSASIILGVKPIEFNWVSFAIGFVAGWGALRLVHSVALTIGLKILVSSHGRRAVAQKMAEGILKLTNEAVEREEFRAWKAERDNAA